MRQSSLSPPPPPIHLLVSLLSPRSLSLSVLVALPPYPPPAITEAISASRPLSPSLDSPDGELSRIVGGALLSLSLSLSLRCSLAHSLSPHTHPLFHTLAHALSETLALSFSFPILACPPPGKDRDFEVMKMRTRVRDAIMSDKIEYQRRLQERCVSKEETSC